MAREARLAAYLAAARSGATQESYLDWCRTLVAQELPQALASPAEPPKSLAEQVRQPRLPGADPSGALGPRDRPRAGAGGRLVSRHQCAARPVKTTGAGAM